MKNFCIFIFSALLSLSCATDSFGVYHTVKKGENIIKISHLYNVDENELRKENSIPEGVSELKEGSSIFIPGAGEVIETESTASVFETPAEVEQSAPDQLEETPEQKTEPEQITPERPETESKTAIDLIWPATGKIVRRFSASTPKSDGIDIQFEKSTEIRAAAEGKVVYSGYKSNYGNLVIIHHNHNFFTIYAYLHTIFAKEGTEIKQNDIIGLADKTETKTVPTLHFEVRNEAKPLDPTKYLPEN